MVIVVAWPGQLSQAEALTPRFALDKRNKDLVKPELIDLRITPGIPLAIIRYGRLADLAEYGGFS